MALLDEGARAQLRRHFDFFDEDHNGFIVFAEFTDILRIMGAHVDSAEARQDFARIDVNGDGQIAFDEFVAWWQTRWYDR